VDRLPSVACALIATALLWRWKSLGGHRPPPRFWLGVALQAPIWIGGDYRFAESWVLAAWGLWLALDALAASCGRPALIGEEPEAAVWALVISTFGWAGIEYLNTYLPTWTLLGFSFNPLLHELSIGLLGAAIVPTVLTVASLISPDSTSPAPPEAATPWRLIGLIMVALAWFLSGLSGVDAELYYVLCALSILYAPRFFAQERGRLLSFAAGAVTWAAFDALWSQAGPGERLYVGYAASDSGLPVILAVCAYCLVAIYEATADLLDKPRLDPFTRPQ
jgi:hypothetical protein